MKRYFILTIALLINFCYTSGTDKLNDSVRFKLSKITGFHDNNFFDENGKSFFPWGLNYCNPVIVNLIEDHWNIDSIWGIINEDFAEMKNYGANTVRIHLQYNRFMIGADAPDQGSFDKLSELVQLAEQNQLYLIITGLGAYRKTDSPEWYDKMDDVHRWETQKVFWRKVASTVKNSNAIFAYDLMNEPVVAVGCDVPENCRWLPGDNFGGFYFIQNISLNKNAPCRETFTNWISEMTSAIRSEDKRTMITVGLLPLGQVNQYAPYIDFVSTHIYPKSGEMEESIKFIINNQSDKPLLIEEFYNMLCSTSELEYFLRQVNGKYNGMIGHYFGKTLDEYNESDLTDCLHKEFLKFFIANNPCGKK